MATRLQLRKGTTTEHSTFVGADGEVTVDTTKKTLVLHDGVTAGGKPLPTLESGRVPLSQLPEATTSTKGVVELATQTEVNSRTDTTRVITPSTLEGGVNTILNASGGAPLFACRAWVNFNGTGTVAIRASGNVSSITDNGTGDYTVNFITALSDVDYALSGICANNASFGAVTLQVAVNGVTRLKTTSSIRVATRQDQGSSTDVDDVSIVVFR